MNTIILDTQLACNNVDILGDPTIFGNLPPHPALGEALKDAVDGNKYNGMAHSSGVVETRQSIAEELSKYPSPYPLSKDVSPGMVPVSREEQATC